MNEPHLPDYVRAEIHFLTECYELAKKRVKTLTRTEFVDTYTRTKFPDLYQAYWNGERHRPKVNDVVSGCLELMCR